MSAAYRSGVVSGESVGTNLAAQEPVGAVNGDVLVGLCFHAGAAPTLPAGWTQISAGSMGGLGWYITGYVVRGSSAPDLTFVCSTSGWRACVIDAISGGQWDKAVTVAGNSATPDPASVVVANADSVVLIQAFSYNGWTASPPTAPSGYTARASSSVDGPVSASKSGTAAGSDDPGSWASSGTSPWVANTSVIGTLGSGGTPLTTPTLSSAVISGTQIDLSWTNVANEDGYTLERSLDGTTYVALATKAVDVTTHSDTGLTPGATYWYRVRANGSGSFSNSGWGATSATTTAPPPATIFQDTYHRIRSNARKVMIGAAIIATAGVIAASPWSTGGGTSSCATSTPNVPGGPDLVGGCFPGPSNTGPPQSEASTAAYTGSCSITTANVTIDAKVINCSPLHVLPGADNLLIKNSYLKGGVVQDNQSASDPAFTIQDSEIDNGVNYPSCASNGGSQTSCPAGKYACGDPNNATTDCGIGYHNFTVLRTELYNSNRAAYCEGNCTIQDSYFHGTNLWPDETNLAHASSVRNEQYLTLTHNSIGCDYTGPFPNGELGCSADMSGYPDFAPIMHATITSNLFLSNNIGAGFCVYGGGTSGKPFSGNANNATYIVFQNNVFQRGANGKCGTYGTVTDFISGRTGNVWSGNVYDNGATVPSA